MFLLDPFFLISVLKPPPPTLLHFCFIYQSTGSETLFKSYRKYPLLFLFASPHVTEETEIPNTFQQCYSVFKEIHILHFGISTRITGKKKSVSRQRKLHRHKLHFLHTAIFFLRQRTWLECQSRIPCD